MNARAARVDYANEMSAMRPVRRLFAALLVVELLAGVRALQFYSRNPRG